MQKSKLSTAEKLGMITLSFLAMSMAVFLMVKNPNMGGDGMRYLIPIHNFIEGNGYTIYGSQEVLMPPGYGMLSYFFYLFVKDIEISGMLASVIAYVLLVPLSFFVTRSLFGNRSAFLAGFFVAFSPIFLKYSYVTISDIAYSAFLVFSFSLCMRIFQNDKNRIIHYFLLGISLGVTYLIRPEAFLIAILTIIASSIFDLVGYRTNKGKEKAIPKDWLLGFLSRQSALILTFLAIILPYILFIHKHTGIWTFSTKSTYNLFIGEKVVKGQAYVDDLMIEHPEYFQPGYTVNLLQYIKANKETFYARLIKNAYSELKMLFSQTFHVVAPLLIVGVTSLFLPASKARANLKTSFKRIKIGAAFLIFLSPIFAFPIFFLAERFLIPYSLLFIILFSGLLEILLKRSLDPMEWKRMSIVGIAGICTLSFVSISGFINFPFAATPSLTDTLTDVNGHLGLRAAGLWLHDNIHVDESLTIISPRKGNVILFYANGKTEPVGSSMNIAPSMTLEKIAAVLRDEDAQYLVIDIHYVATRPQLLPLWNNPDIANTFGLALIFQDTEGLFQIYGMDNL